MIRNGRTLIKFWPWQRDGVLIPRRLTRWFSIRARGSRGRLVKSKVQSPKSKVQGPKSKVQSPKPQKVGRPSLAAMKDGGMVETFWAGRDARPTFFAQRRTSNVQYRTLN